MEKGAATELPEGAGRAVREAITLQDTEFDVYATAGAFTTLEECVLRPLASPLLELAPTGVTRVSCCRPSSGKSRTTAGGPRGPQHVPAFGPPPRLALCPEA